MPLARTQAKELRERVTTHAIHSVADRDARFDAYVRKMELRAQAKALRKVRGRMASRRPRVTT